MFQRLVSLGHWFGHILERVLRGRNSYTDGLASNTKALDGNGAYTHWPDIDEDLSLLSLLAGHANRESEASVERWLAQRRTAQLV